MQHFLLFLPVFPSTFLNDLLLLLFLFKKITIFIYLLLIVLGLCCCMGFFLVAEWRPLSSCGSWVSHWWPLIAEDGLQSSLPGSGIEPVPPALVGRFFTTESPGTPCCFLLMNQFWYLMIDSYGTYELRSVKIFLHSPSQYKSITMYLVKLIFCNCLDMLN